MATVTIEQIRSAINAIQAKWEAGETDVSQYVDRPGVGLFGLSIGEEERMRIMRDAEAAFAAPFPSPPPMVDWRNHNDCNWITSVKFQGMCGSCVSFATCAVLEPRLRLYNRNCALNVDLSEADLFFCGCGACCSAGWNFVPALTRCQANGVGRESDFPYIAQNQPCKGIVPIVQTTGFTMHATAPDRKSAIFNHGPVIGGMRVYEDFYYYKAGVYRHVGGIFKGLHAIAVIGYDDTRDCWIVKNSWGTGWGEKGFCQIGYGEVGIDTLYPFYDPDVTDINTTPVYS